MLSSNAGYREVRAMGWLSEQVHLGGDSSHTEWKPVFVALTEKDMLLYMAAPWSREDWSAPVMSHPLLATRRVQFSCVKCSRWLLKFYEFWFLFPLCNCPGHVRVRLHPQNKTQNVIF